ncbi:hypothetical protein GDO81_020932 [Engystomops pustulosus]|nr:hypothetical protein GDO81_020932 [Engystomops pustulosus]KAG8539425.1 hypothetical protein GDO81_020932 [Engystomops pustulosus]
MGVHQVQEVNVLETAAAPHLIRSEILIKRLLRPADRTCGVTAKMAASPRRHQTLADDPTAAPTQYRNYSCRGRAEG